jgi:type IV pilus assembly protein PilZ
MEVRVEYRTLNGFFADYARNFSRAWTFIRTESPLEIGSEIKFELIAPGLALQLSGNVEEVKADGMRVGFFYRSPEERHETDRRIKQMMLTELGPQLASQLMNQGPASAR